VLVVLNALRMDGERRRQANRHDETSQDLTTRLATLSDREREVLDQILEGKPTRQIADELRITVKTVEFHRARIREKLGVASLPQLFRLFIPAECDA
jgi:RNA polymerase sigma factor (sigma-70 family)